MPDYAALAKKHGGVAKSAPAPQPPQPEPDRTVFGMAPGPELAPLEGVEAQGGPLLPPFAAAGVLGVGRAITGPGNAMARAWSTAKAAAETAAPALKYEAAKTALEGLGMPTPLAVPIAMAISGVKRGGRTPASAPAAAPASPVASTLGAPASPAGPVASQSAPIPAAAPRWSPQRIRNEVGLAEKRNGLKLTEGQREAADRLVAQGADPKTAVATVARQAPAASAPMPTAAAPKPRLSAAEAKQFQRLTQMGKTPDEAYASIELQRGLAARLGTPSPEKVRQAVAERNATGRWRKE